MPEQRIGVVKDYFAKIDVAGIDVEKTIRVGDKIRIAGHTTDLTQVVESMEIDGQQVDEATAGAQIGIKVDERCRGNDVVTGSPTNNRSKRAYSHASLVGSNAGRPCW